MILTVASGKGGTGKTTLSVALAKVAAASRPTTLLDLDVEAPNAGLFLAPHFDAERKATVPIPEIDEAVCTHCGTCAELCAFNALADLGTEVLVFPELCLGCGVCSRHCPEKAIREVPHVLGTMRRGWDGELEFAEGRLHIGRAQATPVIRALKQWALPIEPDAFAILDAPPGSACPVMEAARETDYVILVAEPTPFGLHDLEKAAGALHNAMGLPAGIVINRSRGDDETIHAFAEARGIPILLTIPFDRQVAETVAAGGTLLDARPDWRGRLEDLLSRVTLGSTEGVA